MSYEKKEKKVWLFTNYDKYEECTLYVCYNVVEKRKKVKRRKKRKNKVNKGLPDLSFLQINFMSTLYLINLKPYDITRIKVLFDIYTWCLRHVGAVLFLLQAYGKSISYD